MRENKYMGSELPTRLGLQKGWSSSEGGKSIFEFKWSDAY